MKQFSAALQAHLDTGVTTLSWCWMVTLADATVFGFTDHDKPLTFAGVTFEPDSGFTATAVATSLGLAVDNLDVAGALSSDAITEADLSKGRWNGASVTMYRVNWANTEERYIHMSGTLGQITRGELAFQAEMRGLSHALQQPSGAIYSRSCDALLGDARCGVTPATSTGVVSTVTNNRKLVVTGLTNDTSGFYAHGSLIFSSGRNSGLSANVKSHGVGVIDLWTPAPLVISAGDEFTVTAGCDKAFSTCKTKFSNTVNFRGFNLIPGQDFATEYATSESTTGGGSRYD